jgi:hypothetical protein
LYAQGGDSNQTSLKQLPVIKEVVKEKATAAEKVVVEKKIVKKVVPKKTIISTPSSDDAKPVAKKV